MTKSESDLIRRAIELLRRVVPDDGEPHAVDLSPRRCPVAMFAKEYLVRQPGGDMSTAELFQFYDEVAATGELDRLSKSEFLRRLPNVLEIAFNLRKSHDIQRCGSRVRGFKGITVREQA